MFLNYVGFSTLKDRFLIVGEVYLNTLLVRFTSFFYFDFSRSQLNSVSAR